MLSNQEHYFFDYPVVDANAIAYSAMRLIHYGSTFGTFGDYGNNAPPSLPLDLEKIDAFRINLTFLTSEPLSDAYEYSLVYFNEKISDAIWNGKKRDNTPALTEITRRVLLAASPSLNAKRYRTPFWVKFKKPIYLAKYDPTLSATQAVPMEYIHRFHEKFQGFLIRNESGYPLVRNMFEALGLRCSDRRMLDDDGDGALQVLAYRSTPDYLHYHI